MEINGDVTMEADGRQTSEYRATQSVDTLRLSFAIQTILKVRGINIIGIFDINTV